MMKFRFIYILFASIVVLLVVQSCSSTKYVPEGDLWLQSATVKSDTKAISSMDIEPYIRQKSNYKTLALFRLPLFIYNLSGRDTTKWINRVLKSGGEPPVIYDSTLVEKSVDDITHILANKGYVHAKVTPEISKSHKKAKIKYLIISGNPHRISNYSINISDSVFRDMVSFRALNRGLSNAESMSSFYLNRALMRNTQIKNMSIFDLDALDSERERVSSALKRFGYYDFNKEFIGYVADTTSGKDLVDLELVIYPFMEKNESGKIIESPHNQFVIKDVRFFVDYNPLEDGDVNNYVARDTVHREGGKYQIYYGKRGRYIKPFVITNNCFIVPGSLYNENATTMTYNSLSQLHILRNVNIRYEKITENDSVKLRCIVTCVPDKKQGVSTEIEGTNSGGAFGVGAGIGYTHRNIFKGSELFNAKVHGAYEAINSSSFSNFDKNYFEIGGEMSVTFPRFMFPFLSKDLRRRTRALTQFTSNYIYQRRPDFFTRTILSSKIGYSWQDRRNSFRRHSVDLINISYIHIPDLSLKFDTTLTTAAKVYSFTDQFILSSGYTYTNTNYNPANKRRLNSIYSLRASVETAGNFLALMSTIAGIEGGEEGKKIFNTRYSQYALGNFDYSRTNYLDEKNVVAWRLGGGLVYPYGNNRIVPIQKRFFSGGANSVRGWNIRELGPGAFNKQKKDFYQQSGDIRFDANIEYRSKVFWKLELAAFLDAGNIWTVKEYETQERGVFEFDSFYNQIAFAWGLGFRFDFDFVLVRLDCGWKLYNPASRYQERRDPVNNQIIYVREGDTFKWPVLRPFDLRKNTAWHIAVGYPF